MNDLATAQLQELAAASNGAIEILRTVSRGQTTAYTVSLDTSGITSVAGGIKVRARERFEITAEGQFPFKHPSVGVHHRRWAGSPHVNWGSTLCLYLAPSVEWNPAEGMRGLISRLNLWLKRAASGTLDPHGQPLHPPAAYASGDAGWLVVHPELTHALPLSPFGSTRDRNHKIIYAWCRRRGNRVDIVEWLGATDVYSRVSASSFSPFDAHEELIFVAPVLLLTDIIGFEYPDNVSALATSLDRFGVTRKFLLDSLARASTINNYIKSLTDTSEKFPTILVLGTPGRGVAGESAVTHIVAWKLDDLGHRIVKLIGDMPANAPLELSEEVQDLGRSWMGYAKAEWMVVYENRPETTNRRDSGTAANWLSNKRVLILGCGALGAPIAEHCVRAGVAQLTVADSGAVTPGILVRQPYSDGDIGFSKSWALAKRLSEIRPELTVDFVNGDVVAKFLGATANVSQFDLVVDATANASVRAALEARRMPDREIWPPVLTALFGHDATLGIVTVSHGGSTGSGYDLLRRAAIDAYGFESGAWSDIAGDIFPSTPRSDLFFPEPGCSAPTFVGSSVQTGALASSLFWFGINELTSPAKGKPMSAIATQIGTTSPAPGTTRLDWPNDHVARDDTGQYEIRLTQRALHEMRAETRRGARVRNASIETGGMLLGSFDEAINVVHVDVATGPSPDSKLSDIFFSHGTEGTQEIIDRYRSQTNGRIGFVGIWHTHPYGRAHPSPTDVAGMKWLVSPAGAGRRALMLILGGDHASWTDWVESGKPPSMYVRVVTRPGGEHTVA
ncbi:Molybdopterin-synthase adenylyltransferase [Nocardia cerradoensis]|uniref:Molybdopterin-synthase adenylyltransferase n=1 Tax=Nocardia cerradoensis TaxID=85688 RepID=A0A231HEM6_9NOCA|nr:Molybdopterin-synthase adenylyltransferase [Nocardia cerradoensis]